MKDFLLLIGTFMIIISTHLQEDKEIKLGSKIWFIKMILIILGIAMIRFSA